MIVYIEWVDSAMQHGWMSTDDLNLEPGYCKTCGFLVGETDGVIAISLNGATDKATSPMGEVIVIPKVCITRRIEVPELSKLEG